MNNDNDNNLLIEKTNNEPLNNNSDFLVIKKDTNEIPLIPKKKKFYKKLWFKLIILGMIILLVLIGTLLLTEGKDFFSFNSINNKFSDIVFCENENINIEQFLEENCLDEKLIENICIWSNLKTIKGKLSNIVLYGPTGSGKTYLANILAELEGFAYFRPDLGTEKWVGSSTIKIKNTIKKCKNILKKAKKEKNEKPLFLILDEADRYFPSRENIGNIHSDTNEHLAFMDEILNLNVVVILTTNYLEHIDMAGIRAGRFDMKWEVGFPTIEALEKFIINFNYIQDKNNEKNTKTKEKREIIQNNTNFKKLENNFINKLIEQIQELKKEINNISFKELENIILFYQVYCEMEKQKLGYINWEIEENILIKLITNWKEDKIKQNNLNKNNIDKENLTKIIWDKFFSNK